MANAIGLPNFRLHALQCSVIWAEASDARIVIPIDNNPVRQTELVKPVERQQRVPA